MRTWLLTAPRWVLCLVTGGMFGSFWVLWSRFGQGTSWTGALLLGLLAGVVFGAIMGPFAHRQNRDVRQAVGQVPRDVQRAASRASWRGPAPQDAQVRSIALRLVDLQLTEWARRRTLSLVAFGLALVLYAVLAVTQSPWWWLAFAFFAAMLVLPLGTGRWLRHRRAVLLETVRG